MPTSNHPMPQRRVWNAIHRQPKKPQNFSVMREWPDAPLPDPIICCEICQIMEVCPNGMTPDGWDLGDNTVRCADCAKAPAADTGLFVPSLYAQGEPLASVVHHNGVWLGLSHIISGRIIARHCGEFGFWRVKGSGQ
jgi:hypothetical protein